MSAALLATPLTLLAQLLVLYVLGSYAMSSLGSLGYGSESSLVGRLLFYVLVAPGVISHESAHYLMARLTGTPVGHFVPFAPHMDGSGGIRLGYVTHAARGPLRSALIGLAPVIFNPALLVSLTALITPVELFSGAALLSPTAAPSGQASILRGVSELVAEAGSFAASEPLWFLLWAYLALSLSLGAVPSRSDLAAVPAALLLVTVGGFIYALMFGTGFVWSLSQAAAYGVSLYLLPLLISMAAASAALLSR